MVGVVAIGIAFSSGHLWHKHDRISRVEAANGLADFSDHAGNFVTLHDRIRGIGVQAMVNVDI